MEDACVRNCLVEACQHVVDNEDRGDAVEEFSAATRLP